MNQTIVRGGVYLVASGNAEQPMLIISNHKANKYSPVLIGVSIDRLTSCDEAYGVAVGTYKNRTQYAMCHRIMHIDRSRIGRLIYRIKHTSLKCVESKLIETLDLNNNDCGQGGLRGRIACSSLTGQGSEQTGRRPVVIVSNEKLNQDPDIVNVICVCGTARLSKTPLPTHIYIGKDNGGLAENTLLLCEQVGNIKKNRLTITDNYIRSMAEINAAIKIAIGIEGRSQENIAQR